MAGLAATRLFAAGGAGGVALTAWALRRSGMPRARSPSGWSPSSCSSTSSTSSALRHRRVGLRIGMFPGAAPFALTVVPAIFGGRR